MRRWLYRTIFESDTRAGVLFDVGLLLAILASVFILCIDTLEGAAAYREWLLAAEWFFTVLFTVEYALRLYCSPNPLRYATSFYGLVDLVSILPNYLALLFIGTPTFAVVRAMRIMRAFRILKLVWLVSASDELAAAVWGARA